MKALSIGVAVFGLLALAQPAIELAPSRSFLGVVALICAATTFRSTSISSFLKFFDVRLRLGQETPLPEELDKRAPTAGPRPEDDLAFHGQPDVYGNPEKCPEGSVPEVRITAEEIARAGGLDEYMRHWGHKVPPRA